MLESSVSHVSCDDVALQIENKEGMHRETDCERERERKRKEKVLWSVLQSRCQRKVDGTTLGVILFRLSENSILMDEIFENIFNEELNKLLLVKIQFRENYYDLEIQNLERGNSEYALIESRRELESERRQLSKANQGTGQAQLENTFV